MGEGTWNKLGVACVLAGGLITAGACSSDSKNETSSASSAPGGAATTPGTAATGTTTGTAAGPCPASTDVTVTYGSTGAETTDTYTATTAKADVTLGASAVIVLADFDVPDSEVDAITPPTPPADKTLASVYVSAALDKKALEPGLYEETSSADPKNLQLNREDLYTSAGRQFLTGFVEGASTVTLTEVTKERICGVIDTPMIKSRFAADVITE